MAGSKAGGAASGAASGATAGAAFGPWGAGIGAVLGGLGGMFGSGGHDNSWKQRLQFLVQDAKLAGIHPLAALGASANYSPDFSTSGSSVGDGLADLGRAARGIKSSFEARKAAGDAAAAEAERMDMLRAKNASELKTDDVMRSYYAALTAKALSDAHAGGNETLIEPVPSQVTASDPRRPGVQAGQKPGFVEVKIPGGGSMTIPDQNLVETPEGVGYYMMGRQLMTEKFYPWLLKGESVSGRAAQLWDKLKSFINRR